MTTVFICDDHRIVREGLKQFVQSVPGVVRVETAASGEEVLARYELERPDLVLMDVQMPGLGGLETTRRLVRDHPNARVIMLTAADDRENVAHRRRQRRHRLPAQGRQPRGAVRGRRERARRARTCSSRHCAGR